MIPKFNIIDTSHIKVNKNFTVDVIEYGKNKHPVLIIDNFLENPQSILDIIFQYPFPERTVNCNNHPGWRVLCRLQFEDIRIAINHLVEHYYDIGNFVKSRGAFYGLQEPSIEFQFNLYQGGTPCLLSTILPHTDTAFIAFNLYLNSDEECKGGTDLYTHLPSGLESDYSYIFGSKFKDSEEYKILTQTRSAMWNDNYETIHDDFEIEKRSSVWKKELTLEVKFNRLVIYPAYLFHAVGMKKDWYPNKRYSLAGFVL